MSHFGVYFSADRDAVTLAVTVRADLQLGRLGLHAEQVAIIEAANASGTLTEERSLHASIVGLIIAPSQLAAEKLLAVLTRFWSQRGRMQDGKLVLRPDDVSISMQLCQRAFGFKGYPADAVPSPKVRKKAPRVGASATDVIEPMLVPDPMISDAEFLHQQRKNPGKVNVGMVRVEMNMSTLIGGLARVRSRSEAHRLAAAMYRGLHDRAQIGSPKAVDPSKEKVDGSGSSESTIFEVGENARREYFRVVQVLGIVTSTLIEKVIVHDVSVSAMARTMYGNAGGAARVKVTDALGEAMDELAIHFGLMGKPVTGSKVRSWDDGTDLVFTGEVRNPKRSLSVAA